MFGLSYRTTPDRSHLQLHRPASAEAGAPQEPRIREWKLKYNFNFSNRDRTVQLRLLREAAIWQRAWHRWYITSVQLYSTSVAMGLVVIHISISYDQSRFESGSFSGRPHGRCAESGVELQHEAELWPSGLADGSPALAGGPLPGPSEPGRLEPSGPVLGPGLSRR